MCKNCGCNNDVEVKIEMLEGCELFKPVKAHPEDAAFDLYAVEDAKIEFGSCVAVSVGFRMELPHGYCAKILPRSGNALKKGITIGNTPGLIDENYRGVVKAIVLNVRAIADDELFGAVEIKKGDKIAQMVIEKVLPVKLTFDKVDMNTDRGEAGFGSTGLAGNNNN